ncbi:hypothetical protein [Prosthecobacter sp.]|uniref:hypothetical protein n=1 Tax=Prosthecobacter sp. TaxID=1965333 RepID=UPI0037849499
MIAPGILRVSLLAIVSGASVLSMHAGVPEVPPAEDPSIRIIDDPMNPVLFHHERQVNGMLGEEDFGRFRAMRYIHGAMMIPAGFGMSWTDDDGKYEVPLVDLVGSLDAPEVHHLSSLESYDERYVSYWPAIQRMKALEAFKQRDESFLQAGKLYVSRLSESERKEYEPALKDGRGVIGPRALNEFETAAFRLLQAGHAMVVKQEGEVFRALGAIRMQESCRRCHDDKKNGDLLGAFTYLGLREREATDDERKRRAQLRLDAQGDIKDTKFMSSYMGAKALNYDDESKAFLLDRKLRGEGVITQHMVDRMRALRAKLPDRKNEKVSERMRKSDSK